MKTISKPVRASEETFKAFKILAVTEGRTMGKMLEILIKKYNEFEKENENGTTQNV
jgi:hypothetical protein